MMTQIVSGKIWANRKFLRPWGVA